MLISICGDKKNKGLLIEKLKNTYGDKVVVCNYFVLRFNTVIDNEKKYYEILKREPNRDLPKETENNFIEKLMILTNEKHIEFNNYIDKIVNDKITNILKCNKDKIILLVTDNNLTIDIDKISIFNASDLKILVTPDKNNVSDIYEYSENDYDYVINDIDNIDVKRLVFKNE